MKPIAYEGKEKYIFISYAHKDSDTVLRIMNSLQSAGYRIWYDDGIIPGSEWPENIAMHLNDAAMVIAMISPNSMASHNCRREINFALSKQKPVLSVVVVPTEMSLGMEMQLSAQNIVMRQNYSRWEEFITKIMLCPGLEPCKMVEGESADQYIPRGMQMESQSDPFVMGAPAAEPPKKKKNPLILICGILAACVVGLGAMMFLGDGETTIEDPPTTIMPIDFSLDYTPQGTLLVDGKWPSGTVEVYTVDERNYEILLTDYWMPNGYPFSETPGKRDPYWNVAVVAGASDMVSMNIFEYESAPGQFYGDCLYYHENATYTCDGYFTFEEREHGFVIKLELPQEVPWNTDDIAQIYVNVGTENAEMTEHFDFWVK